MKKDDDLILVPRRYVARFLKDFVVAHYSMKLFTYLAENRQLELHMDADEVCNALNITRQQLDVAWRRGEIKSFKFGGIRVFSAFDVAKVAELIHRPKRLRKLAKIPAAN